MLPASELYHMADLVCVVSPCDDDSSNMSGVSVMAVSPEGMVRYWPSLTHGSSSIDLDTDLIGSQCHSLTAFQVGPSTYRLLENKVPAKCEFGVST